MEGAQLVQTDLAVVPTNQVLLKPSEVPSMFRSYTEHDLVLETDELLLFDRDEVTRSFALGTIDYSNPMQIPFEIITADPYDMAPNNCNNAYFYCSVHEKFEHYPKIHSILQNHWVLDQGDSDDMCYIRSELGESRHPYLYYPNANDVALAQVHYNEFLVEWEKIHKIKNPRDQFYAYLRFARGVCVLSRTDLVPTRVFEWYVKSIRKLIAIDESTDYALSKITRMSYEHTCDVDDDEDGVRCSAYGGACGIRGFSRRVPIYRVHRITHPGRVMQPDVDNRTLVRDPNYNFTLSGENFEQHGDNGNVWKTKKTQNRATSNSDNVKLNGSSAPKLDNNELTAEQVKQYKECVTLVTGNSNYKKNGDALKLLDRKKFFLVLKEAPDISKWGWCELAQCAREGVTEFNDPLMNLVESFRVDVYTVLSCNYIPLCEKAMFRINMTDENVVNVFRVFRENKVKARELYDEIRDEQWKLKQPPPPDPSIPDDGSIPFSTPPSVNIWEKVKNYTESMRKQVVEAISSIFTESIGKVVSDAVQGAKNWFVENRDFLVQMILDVLTLSYCYKLGWSSEALIILSATILRHMFPGLVTCVLDKLESMFSKPFEQHGGSTSVWLVALSALAIMSKVCGVIVTMKHLILFGAVIGALDRVAMHSDNILEFLITNLPAAMGAWLRPLLSYDPVRKLTYDTITFDMYYSSQLNADSIRKETLSAFVRDYHAIQVAFREHHKKAQNNDCNTIRTTLKKYEAAYHNAIQRIGVGGDRIPSVWLFLFGKTGVGKTELVSRLCREMSPELFPTYFDNNNFEVDIQGLKYARQIGQKFWNGYSGQPIIYVDDWGAQREDPFIMETLVMCGCDAFLPNMASLSDPGVGVKGTPYTSEMIITTSNGMTFIHNELTNHEAVLRRRNIIYEIDVDPDVYNIDKGTVDDVRLKEKYTDHDDLMVSWPHLKFKQYNPTTKGTSRHIATHTFREFTTHVIEFVKDFRIKAIDLRKAKAPHFFLERSKLKAKWNSMYNKAVEENAVELTEFKVELLKGDEEMIPDLSSLKIDTGDIPVTPTIEHQGKDDELPRHEHSMSKRKRIIHFAHNMGDPEHLYCENALCRPQVLYTAAQKMWNKHNIMTNMIEEKDQDGGIISRVECTPAMISNLFTCKSCDEKRKGLGLEPHSHTTCLICRIYLYGELNKINALAEKNYKNNPKDYPKPLPRLYTHYINNQATLTTLAKGCTRRCICAQLGPDSYCVHCTHCEFCTYVKYWSAEMMEDPTFQNICLGIGVIRFMLMAVTGYYVTKKAIGAFHAIQDYFNPKPNELIAFDPESDQDKLLEKKERREAAFKKRGERRAEKAAAGGKRGERTVGKQQGRFTTYYKDGKQHIEPRPLQGHASDGLSNRLQKLLCNISVYNEATGKIESGGGWRVKGRMVVFTAHYLENLEVDTSDPNFKIMMTLPNSSRTQYKCSVDQCKFYQFCEYINDTDVIDLDLVAILLPDDAPVATDNMELFIKEKNLDYINTGEMLLFGLNTTFNKLYMSGVSNVKRIQTPLECTDRYLVSGFTYHAPSAVPGWCTFPLVDFTKDNGCIVGAHVGKYAGTSIHRAEAVTYEMMMHAFDSVMDKSIHFIQEGLPSWVQENKAANFMPPDHVEYLGAVANAYAVQLPNKTDLEPSPLSAHINPGVPWQMTKKAPAVLSTKDSRHHTEHSPLYNAIAGYQCSGHLTGRQLRLATDMCFREVYKQPPGLARVLTEEEAINGIQGLEFFQALDMTTSPGYPYVKMRPFGAKGKLFLFDFVTDEENRVLYKPGPLLRKFADESLSKLKQGIIPGDRWAMDVLKDEKLKDQKIIDELPRLFDVLPVDILIAEKRYYGAFNAMYIRSHNYHHGSVGLNPRSLEWDQQYKFLCEVGSKNGIDGDIGAWDKVSPTQAEPAFLSIVERWYKLNDPNWTEEDARVRAGLSAWRNHCVHIAHDAIYRTHGGTISGSLITAVGNCIKNDVYHKAAFIELLEASDYKESHKVHNICLQKTLDYYVTIWENNVRLKDWGDDIVISVSDSIKHWFNGEAISAWWGRKGIKYTPSDKKSSFVWKPVKDLEYLKAYTHIDERTGVAYPRFTEGQYDEILNWVRKPSAENGTIYDQAGQNAEACLQFVLFNGRARFNQYRDKIMQILAGTTDQYFPSFDEYIDMLIDNGHYTDALKQADWVKEARTPAGRHVQHE